MTTTWIFRSLNRFVAAALVFGTTLCLGAGANAAPGVITAAEQESLASLAKLSDAVWNRRDAAALAAYYASDASSTIGTVELTGRPAILDYFTKSLKAVPAGITHRTVIKRLEKLDGDLIAVDSAVYLEVPDGAQGKRVVREFFTFGLLRKAGSGWEMVAVRAIPLGAPSRPAA